MLSFISFCIYSVKVPYYISDKWSPDAPQSEKVECVTQRLLEVNLARAAYCADFGVGSIGGTCNNDNYD